MKYFLTVALLAFGVLGLAAQTPRVTLWTGFDAALLKGAKLNNLTAKSGSSLELRLSSNQKIGSLETAAIKARFDTMVLSFNGLTPDKTNVLLEARVQMAGVWSKYYRMGLWTTDPNQTRRSFDGQRDANGTVETDTLSLSKTADALQIKVSFSSSVLGVTPTLTGLAAVMSDAKQHDKVVASSSNKRAWGTDLAVPMRSQMIYPNGGRVWCSPTSTTMLLEYWSAKLGRNLADSVPEAVKNVWDSTYDGAGNWSFNVAYAGSKGLRAYVNRLSSLTEAEKFIARGVPLVLSVAWEVGTLDGAALPSSNGHLLVLRGFAKNGDPIVNDPAAPTDAEVQRVYKRTQFEKAWIQASGGIVYVIEPRR